MPLISVKHKRIFAEIFVGLERDCSRKHGASCHARHWGRCSPINVAAVHFKSTRWSCHPSTDNYNISCSILFQCGIHCKRFCLFVVALSCLTRVLAIALTKYKRREVSGRSVGGSLKGLPPRSLTFSHTHTYTHTHCPQIPFNDISQASPRGQDCRWFQLEACQNLISRSVEVRSS